GSFAGGGCPGQSGARKEGGGGTTVGGWTRRQGRLVLRVGVLGRSRGDEADLHSFTRRKNSDVVGDASPRCTDTRGMGRRLPCSGSGVKRKGLHHRCGDSIIGECPEIE